MPVISQGLLDGQRAHAYRARPVLGELRADRAVDALPPGPEGLLAVRRGHLVRMQHERPAGQAAARSQHLQGTTAATLHNEA